jgi:hypothetical protein
MSEPSYEEKMQLNRWVNFESSNGNRYSRWVGTSIHGEDNLLDVNLEHEALKNRSTVLMSPDEAEAFGVSSSLCG